MKTHSETTTSREATCCVLDAAVRLLSSRVIGATRDAAVSLDPLWCVFASDEATPVGENTLRIQAGPLAGSPIEPAGARGTGALRLFLNDGAEPVVRVSLPPLLACPGLAKLDESVLDAVLELYQGLVGTLDDAFAAVDAAVSLVQPKALSCGC